MIIDCKFISKKIELHLKNIIEKYSLSPQLTVIQVGNNKASESYIKNKIQKCENLGIVLNAIKLPCSITQKDLNNIILNHNKNKNTNGIILLNPLPSHLNYKASTDLIDPLKDVDGANIESKYMPCTAKAVLDLFKILNISIEGKECVVIGRGIVSGEPVAKMLEDHNATVIKCNSFTKNISKHTLSADVIISATGFARHINDRIVKNNAIIIDMGVCYDENNKLSGDVDTKSVSDIGCCVTSVPNGIGLITTSELLLNTVKNCYMSKKYM